MTKRNIGNEIIKGMEDAVNYMRGKKVHTVVRKVVIPAHSEVEEIEALVYELWRRNKRMGLGFEDSIFRKKKITR